MRFGHGRKTKNDENCISATAETEEMPHNGFPTPWKWKKRLTTAFQPLGNGRNTSKQLSNPLEMEKMPHNGFPTPWKWKKRLTTGFPTPWKWKKCLKTGFPTPWKQKDRCLGRIRFIVIFVI